MSDAPSQADTREVWRGIRARHPGFRRALLADARLTARHRGERHEFRPGLDAAARSCG